MAIEWCDIRKYLTEEECFIILHGEGYVESSITKNTPFFAKYSRRWDGLLPALVYNDGDYAGLTDGSGWPDNWDATLGWFRGLLKKGSTYYTPWGLNAEIESNYSGNYRSLLTKYFDSARVEFLMKETAKVTTSASDVTTAIDKSLPSWRNQFKTVSYDPKEKINCMPGISRSGSLSGYVGTASTPTTTSFRVSSFTSAGTQTNNLVGRPIVLGSWNTSGSALPKIDQITAGTGTDIDITLLSAADYLEVGDAVILDGLDQLNYNGYGEITAKYSSTHFEIDKTYTVDYDASSDPNTSIRKGTVPMVSYIASATHQGGSEVNITVSPALSEAPVTYQTVGVSDFGHSDMDAFTWESDRAIFENITYDDATRTITLSGTDTLPAWVDTTYTRVSFDNAKYEFTIASVAGDRKSCVINQYTKTFTNASHTDATKLWTAGGSVPYPIKEGSIAAHSGNDYEITAWNEISLTSGTFTTATGPGSNLGAPQTVVVRSPGNWPETTVFFSNAAKRSLPDTSSVTEPENGAYVAALNAAKGTNHNRAIIKLNAIMDIPNNTSAVRYWDIETTGVISDIFSYTHIKEVLENQIGGYLDAVLAFEGTYSPIDWVHVAFDLEATGQVNSISTSVVNNGKFDDIAAYETSVGAPGVGKTGWGPIGSYLRTAEKTDFEVSGDWEDFAKVQAVNAMLKSRFSECLDLAVEQFSSRLGHTVTANSFHDTCSSPHLFPQGGLQKTKSNCVHTVGYPVNGYADSGAPTLAGIPDGEFFADMENNTFYEVPTASTDDDYRWRSVEYWHSRLQTVIWATDNPHLTWVYEFGDVQGNIRLQPIPAYNVVNHALKKEIWIHHLMCADAPIMINVNNIDGTDDTDSSEFDDNLLDCVYEFEEVVMYNEYKPIPRKPAGGFNAGAFGNNYIQSTVDVKGTLIHYFTPRTFDDDTTVSMNTSSDGTMTITMVGTLSGQTDVITLDYAELIVPSSKTTQYGFWVKQTPPAAEGPNTGGQTIGYVQIRQLLLREQLALSPEKVGPFQYTRPGVALFLTNNTPDPVTVYVETADAEAGPYTADYTEDNEVMLNGYGRTMIPYYNVKKWMSFHLSRVSDVSLRIAGYFVPNKEIDTF